ncbi:MAG TPA: 2-oxo acid dehydrogenase subunit E2, partial [Saprospiraceae bacterium]|nr:2-oxo acid dehydrogenase subunit E2 [Saprospiraceae bacterium]
MAQVELIMPKMGESIMEATILKWVKNVGDTVEVDETILEIATDKVDSEIPSPVNGTIAKILFEENDVVEIGKVIAIIATEGEEPKEETNPALASTNISKNGHQKEPAPAITNNKISSPVFVEGNYNSDSAKTTRFYSPLVKSIAKKENIGLDELEQISGSGANGRVTKKDILSYISNRTTTTAVAPKSNISVPAPNVGTSSNSAISTNGAIEIVEMSRMRKLIADHMVMSKRTSPHVTSFIEVDVTNIVNWRNAHKDKFQKTHGEKITFTPIFIEAVVQAIQDFPMVNVSVDGQNIIVKKDINIGMATALPSGNLIVPVIKNADRINLLGLTKAVNSLAAKARANKLKPEEIQDGTFTLTNVGTFGNVMGTPIINQPQVAILAIGAIRKKPAVLETEYGDVIAVRQMMFMSLSYDHRVVDGFLGG